MTWQVSVDQRPNTSGGGGGGGAASGSSRQEEDNLTTPHANHTCSTAPDDVTAGDGTAATSCGENRTKNCFGSPNHRLEPNDTNGTSPRRRMAPAGLNFRSSSAARAESAGRGLN